MSAAASPSRTRRAKWSMRGSVTGSDTPFIVERDLRGTFLNAGAAERVSPEPDSLALP